MAKGRKSNFQAQERQDPNKILKERAGEIEIDVESLEREETFELPQIGVEEIDAGKLKVARLMLTPDLVAVAIYEARGLPSVAARKLGTTVRVVMRFIKDHEVCRIASEEAEAMLLDFAEAKLMQKIKAGDIASIIFYLRTKGKTRGYTEKEIDKAADNKRIMEEAKREAEEREVEIMGKLERIGERLRDIGDMDLSQKSYATDDDEEEEVEVKQDG